MQISDGLVKFADMSYRELSVGPYSSSCSSWRASPRWSTSSPPQERAGSPPLRGLREHEVKRLTQGDLGQALGGDEALSTATISMWENPASGRLPPAPSGWRRTLRLYCTPRSFESGEGVVRMLDVAELTAQERDRMEELREELLDLRENVVPHGTASVPDEPQSMWHFPDGSRITLVCYRLPPERRRPQSADDSILNYVRLADLADLDTLVDIYGAIRAYNPRSRVVIKAAQDLTRSGCSEPSGANRWMVLGHRDPMVFPDLSYTDRARRSRGPWAIIVKAHGSMAKNLSSSMLLLAIS